MSRLPSDSRNRTTSAPETTNPGHAEPGFCAPWFGVGLACLLLGFGGISLARAASVPATFTTLLTNGPAANRLNVVFLSEGYTSSQLGQYLVDATNALRVLLNKAPFQEYRSYVNAFAISVPSNQSGSDHPNGGHYVDTYFNSSYDPLSDLYITVPPNDQDANASHGQGKIDALVRRFMPKCGLSVLLVNDVVPGGSDGFDKTAVFSAGHLAFLPHEAGHVLAGLGDEYTLENPSFPSTEEPNTTREVRPDFIKWKAWIDASTPIPTPESDAYKDVIGLFAGAHYHTSGWYRPKLDCAMNHSDAEFCQVCSEALVLAFYNKVRPIDQFAPTAANLTVYAPEPVVFSLELPQPLTHSLTVQWYTNGVLAGDATTLNLSSSLLKIGANNVRAVVKDPTPLVRTDTANRLGQNVTWTLNVKPAVKPLVTIASPANLSRITNGPALLSGTAKDVRYGLARLEYQVNDGPFQIAAGTSNWTAKVDLVPGTNLVRVRSINQVGTPSDPATRALFRVVTSPLTVTQTGSGTVTPLLGGQRLEIGRSYTLTAKPAAGFVFSNWSGGLVWTNPVLIFQMRTNLALQANFCTNPFIRLQGSYNGLFAGTPRAQESSGALSLTLTDRGTYSGSLLLGANRYSLSGQFDVAGRSAKLISRPKSTPLSLRLELDLTPGSDRLSGSVGDGQWLAGLAAVRAGFTANRPATRFQGKYTLTILGEADPALPTGDGFAAMTIDTTGKVALKGSLADGTPFTQSSCISIDGLWPCYTAIHSGKGSLHGWIVHVHSNAPQANLNWIKPAMLGTKLYGAGFTNTFAAWGGAYLAPSTGARVLALTNAAIVFEAGNLVTAFTNQVALGTNNKFVNKTANALTLSLTVSSGLFTGTVVPPAGKASIPIQGILIQGLNSGFGYFLGTNQSGRISIRSAD